MTDAAPHWTPSPERIAAAQLTRFHDFARGRGAPAGDYAALWQWSVDEPAAFWNALVEFTAVIGDRGDGPVLSDGHLMPGAKWFPGMRLNFAENLLRHSGSDPALIARDERGRRREISRDELRAEVARIADGLRAAGVVAGDAGNVSLSTNGYTATFTNAAAGLRRQAITKITSTATIPATVAITIGSSMPCVRLYVRKSGQSRSMALP